MRRHVSIGSFGLPLALALASGAFVACGGASAESEGANSAGDAVHPLVGKPGPDFAQKSVGGGSTVSFKSLSGKVAIVDFWATWCEPCKKSFPKLQDLKVKYGSQGLEIVGISEDDDKSGIPSFASDLGAKFTLVWDEDKAIASKWQPKSMPSTFIVDRTGTVRFVHLGYHEHEELDIEREIKSLL